MYHYDIHSKVILHGSNVLKCATLFNLELMLIKQRKRRLDARANELVKASIKAAHFANLLIESNLNLERY